MRTRKKPKFKLPNKLITDYRLSYSARRLGAVIYSRRNALGAYRKSLEGLARLSRLSVPTVQKAVAQLEQAGYISHKRNYVYDYDLKRVVYAQNTYLCSLDYSGGFTLIPHSLLEKRLTPAAFTVSLYIFQQMGNSDRAWPKIRDIITALTSGRATVCRALAAIRTMGVMLVLRCKKRNRAYTSNSYHPLTGYRTAASDMFQASEHSAIPWTRSAPGTFNRTDPSC